MANKILHNLASKLIPWRGWVQAAFLMVWLDPLALRLHNICGPVFHCYSCPLATFACPIGVLANFSALHIFPFIAIGVLVIVGMFLGTLVCGWLCPFGFFQDLVGKIPVRKFRLSTWTGYFRYVVLAVTVFAIPYFFGEAHPLFICRLCPAGGIEGGIPNMAKQAMSNQPVSWMSLDKIIIIVLIVAAMVFIWRPWCRLFCPLGAIFSLFNRFSAFFIRLEPHSCTNCGKCYKICKYGTRPDINADNAHCIRCLECSQCGPGAITIDSIFTKEKSD